MNSALIKLQSGMRVPIENIVCQSAGGAKRWSQAYMRFAQRGGQSLELHKEKLGKQTCVFTGSEYRHWVWERPRWTVLVSKRGVELNVNPELLIEDAWELWRDYLRKLGLLNSLRRTEDGV